MEGTGSVQACALVLITYGSQGCPDDQHQKNFIASIRGLEKPNGDALQGHLSASLVHLGNIAYRTGNQHLVFDGEKEQFTNNTDANKFLKSSYREQYAIPDQL